MDEKREYWAFISYRHLDNHEAGREWATWIAREIETYEVPPELVGTTNGRGDEIPERIYPVFRDEDELSADDDLASPIYEALRNSKTIVVVCSPNAVGSRYVNNEITYFKSLGRADRVLAMMIAGEPHDDGGLECFPEALKHPVDEDGELDRSVDTEPVAADFRLVGGDQGWTTLADCRKNLPDKHTVEKYRERCDLAKLKIIAGILDVPLGVLAERDKAYQLARARRRARIFTAVAAAMAILAIIAIVAGFVAMNERDQAQRSEKVALHARGTAEELIGEMLFEMGNKLEPLGRLDLLEDISLSAESYFKGLPEDQIDAESERNRSVMLDSRARISRSSGDLEVALKYYSEALEIVKKLAEGDPDNLVLENDIIVSLQQVADILILQNRQEEALSLYEEASSRLQDLTEKRVGSEEAQRLFLALLGEYGPDEKELAREVLHENPGICGLMATSAVLMERLGKIAFNSGRFDDAESHFQGAVEIQTALQVVQPDSRQVKTSLYSGINDLGNVDVQRLDCDAAAEHFEDMVDLAEAELEKDPKDATWQEKLANALSRLGVAVSQLGEAERYRDLQMRAMEQYRALSESDPGNVVRLRNYLVGLSQVGIAEKANGNYEKAREYLEKSGEIAATLVETDPSNTVWRQDYAFSLAQQADALRLAERFQDSVAVRLEELEQQRIVSEGNPDNLLYRRNLVYTLNAVGIAFWAIENLDEAVRYLGESEKLATGVLEQIDDPTTQHFKDINDIRGYLGSIEEQRNHFADAVKWYEGAVSIATEAYDRGLAWESLNPQAFLTANQKIESLRALSLPEGQKEGGNSPDRSEKPADPTTPE